MAKKRTMLDRMRVNPRDDWRIEDVETVCRRAGIAVTSHGGGSHRQLRHPSQRDILTVPARRPIKPAYIKMLVAFVDAVEQSR